jgi:hypothetical protein
MHLPEPPAGAARHLRNLVAQVGLERGPWNVAALRAARTETPIRNRLVRRPSLFAASQFAGVAPEVATTRTIPASAFGLAGAKPGAETASRLSPFRPVSPVKQASLREAWVRQSRFCGGRSGA